MRLDLQIPMTFGQLQRRAVEVKALVEAGAAELRGQKLKITVHLENLSVAAVDDLLITIRAARMIAGVDDRQNGLVEEALTGLKEALS